MSKDQIVSKLIAGLMLLVIVFLIVSCAPAGYEQSKGNTKTEPTAPLCTLVAEIDAPVAKLYRCTDDETGQVCYVTVGFTGQGVDCPVDEGGR